METEKYCTTINCNNIMKDCFLCWKTVYILSSNMPLEVAMISYETFGRTTAYIGSNAVKHCTYRGTVLTVYQLNVHVQYCRLYCSTADNNSCFLLFTVLQCVGNVCSLKIWISLKQFFLKLIPCKFEYFTSLCHVLLVMYTNTRNGSTPLCS